MIRKPFTLAVTYLLIVIFVAHFLPPPGYKWTLNTISDLASQGHVYKWIMQAGFIGFGLILAVGVVYYFRQNKKLVFLFFVAVYGLSILVTGFFCAAAIDLSIPYSVSEAQTHSLFATIAGIAMSLGIFWQVMVSSNRRDRWIRLAFFFGVMGISGLFGLAENHVLALDKGIIQRALYLLGLLWLVYEERQIHSLSV